MAGRQSKARQAHVMKGHDGWLEGVTGTEKAIL
jgi:hypothetical protein